MEVVFKKSTRQGKKLMAIFYNDGKKVKTIHFGSLGYESFITHKDQDRKQRYINRHRKNEDWNNYMTSGSLAYHILWNKPTLKASIEDYKRKFGLK